VKRGGGGNLASLNWVGETFYSLGAGFDEGDGRDSPRARSYFQRAAAAYQQMLELAQNDPKYKDEPDALVGIRLRLADCYRGAGNFDAALKAVADVLRDRQMLLSAQVQAAEIYQAKGAADPKSLALAIMGDMPNREGRNLVWGWAKISKMTMGNPKFDETFHQSRLSIAESRYRYALAQKDEARKVKVLEAAVQDLWQTYKLRPDLGGSETAPRYDRALKKLQKALGRKESGLQEFRERDAAAAAAAK
jgi:tetratricopeptide (TPR) repeat protein